MGSRRFRNGIRGTLSVSSRFGCKLPLLFCADVRTFRCLTAMPGTTRKKKSHRQRCFGLEWVSRHTVSLPSSLSRRFLPILGLDSVGCRRLSYSIPPYHPPYWSGIYA